LIAYLAAEATHLERALTKPLETDDLYDDLSITVEPDLEPNAPATEGTRAPAPKKKQPTVEPDLEPNNIAPATEGTRAPTPKKKQPAKRKSPSKTNTEGMCSQYFGSWSLAYR
jgi:hypothetical protein